MYKCKICSFETDIKLKLGKHIQHTHKLKKEEYILQTQYNGVNPLCSCGCGKKTHYEAKIDDFCKWIVGHQAKISNEHFGKRTPEMYEKISKTRKSKFESGEYTHVLKAIKENRKQPDLGVKISKGAKGIPKPKPKGFGVGRIQSQKTKDKMSKTAIKNILKTGKVKRSNLEYKFEAILELYSIKYTHSYYIESINKIYDFYLPDYNILVEVDGDFWHCNPLKFPNPECKTQKINLENDKFKTQWALDNGYKLLRFWENDINNNIHQVKQILLENCK